MYYRNSVYYILIIIYRSHFSEILRDDYFFDDIPIIQLKRMIASIGGNYRKDDNKSTLIDKINRKLTEITSN